MNQIMKHLILMGMLISLAVAGEGKMELKTVENLDLERFMGDWYVIANIPTFIEKNTSNNLEQYALRPDGDVDITFSLVDEDGKPKSYSARGFVLDPSDPARWKVQFFWPIRFPFHVIDIDEDYSYTVIGLPNRKYVWIMSRTDEMSETLYQEILERLANQGYDLEKIQRVKWL